MNNGSCKLDFPYTLEGASKFYRRSAKMVVHNAGDGKCAATKGLSAPLN
jgi:hypothetical protein